MTGAVADDPIESLDRWIRKRFIAINAELEDLYASRANRISVEGIGGELKAGLAAEGEDLIKPILSVPGLGQAGFDKQLDILGNVGFFMAACRRHEITEPSREQTSPLVFASQLANLLGGAIGVVPRFTAVHNQTHNRAVNGVYRTFTGRQAERTFVEFNTRSALAYMRAADALVRIPPLGISNPIAKDLLVVAEQALIGALALNKELSATLDIDEFYFCVRPYYKPYRVGAREYRGANAGDFAAFNQIDLLLGLCSLTDPTYTQIVLDKKPYLTPDEQQKLAAACGMPNLLDEFLTCAGQHEEPWFEQNASAYLRVCDALGAAAAHHHDNLVIKFLAEPSVDVPEDDLKHITASGPPLQMLLRALEDLRDLRLCAERDDIPSRHRDLATLRSLAQP